MTPEEAQYHTIRNLEAQVAELKHRVEELECMPCTCPTFTLPNCPVHGLRIDSRQKESIL